MRRVHPLLLLVTAAAVVSVPFAVGAQSAAPSAATASPLPTTRVAIRAGRLVDVRAGTIVRDVVILVDGERITAVGPAVRVPPDVRVIDLGDATVLPGLIDAHTHLLHEYHRGTGGDEENRVLEVVRLGPARRALLGARLAHEMLEAGFTTVRDLGNSGVDGAAALRDAVAAGWIVGRLLPNPGFNRLAALAMGSRSGSRSRAWRRRTMPQ